MPNASLRASLEQATALYAENAGRAHSYLQGRGLTEDVSAAFRLGYVTDPVPGHERFIGMLTIPYLTRAGVVALKFRCIEDHKCGEFGHAKYGAPTGQQARMFNVNALFGESEVVAICEGEFDAMVLTALCGVPAIGVPGVSHWKDHFPRMFAGFPRVLIVADNDGINPDTGKNPGREFAVRVRDDIQHAHVVELPEGTDVNSLYLAEGREALRARLGV